MLPTLPQVSRLNYHHWTVTHSPLALVSFSDRSFTCPPSASDPTWMLLTYLHVHPDAPQVSLSCPQGPDHPCCPSVPLETQIPNKPALICCTIPLTPFLGTSSSPENLFQMFAHVKRLHFPPERNKESRAWFRHSGIALIHFHHTTTESHCPSAILIHSHLLFFSLMLFAHLWAPFHSTCATLLRSASVTNMEKLQGSP